jgi:Cytochrome c oxidase subunit IV
MFTTGSKFFFGITTAALVAAALYGLGSAGGKGELMGTWLLVTLGVVALTVGSVVIAYRDSDPTAVAQLHAASAADGEGQRGSAPLTESLWPLLTAVGVLVTAIGLVQDSKMFILGLCITGVAIVEWAVLGWSDRASVDPAYNSELRGKIMRPFEMPVLGALIVGFIAIGASRTLLAVTHLQAVIVLSIVAAIIFVIAIAVAQMPQGTTVSRRLGGTLAALGVVGVLSSWVTGVAAGEHTVEKAAKEQGTKSVSLKSAVVATIKIKGATSDTPTLSIPRASTVNIRLQNDAAEEVAVELLDPTGQPVKGVETPPLAKGASRILTLRIPVGGLYELGYTGAAGSAVTQLQVL